MLPDQAIARAVCADALSLARLQRDGRAWAVLAWRSELPDPMTAFRAAAGRRRTLLWSDDGWLLGAGEAWSVAADGPGRTAHLAVAAARLEARCVIGGADGALPPLPCLLSALSFEDVAPGPSHWGPGLSGARLWLPRRLWWKRGNDGWIVAALALSAGDRDPALLAERLLSDPASITPSAPTPWPTLSTDYVEQVDDAVALIRDGALRKIVLARAVDESTTCDAAGVLENLARLYPSTTLYAVDGDDGATFVGATPELLFSARGQRVDTMALAGSAGGEAEAAYAALMASTKERKEHNLVVEHLVTVLRARAQPFTFPSAPTARRLNQLTHLQTPISADLKQADQHADYLELLGALHPTPAVCGLPTPTATHWIARHERLHRGLYTGAIGHLTPTEARIVVPLRGGIIRDGSARLFAGAGIVETSEPERELAETELKFGAMRAALV